MEKIPFTAEHEAILKMYGLQDLPPKHYTCVRYKVGERITEEDAPISVLGLVTKGNAKICRTAPNGKNLILCMYISEGVIGEIELLTGQKTATTTVIALSDFECILIEYKRCLEELEKNLVFSNRLATILADKLLQSANGLASSVLYSGQQRLCSYILQNSQRGNFSETLTDVASSIGISYRHLFRLLEQLCRDGILEKVEGGYKIQQLNELVKRTE